MISELIATRVKHGADTPAGYACSDIVQNIESHTIAKAEGNAFRLKKLAELMPERVKNLADELARHQ